MTTVVALLPWIQIVLSVALIVAILIQQSDAALGAVFGGSGGENVARTRRGFELFLFRLTIVLAILFAATSLLALFVS